MWACVAQSYRYLQCLTIGAQSQLISLQILDKAGPYKQYV